MTASTSIGLDQKCYDQARAESVTKHRTIAGQVEYWARVGRAAVDDPDLPVSFCRIAGVADRASRRGDPFRAQVSAGTSYPLRRPDGSPGLTRGSTTTWPPMSTRRPSSPRTIRPSESAGRAISPTSSSTNSVARTRRERIGFLQGRYDY